MRYINSSRGLILAKLTASAISLVWLVILARYIPSADLGTIFETLFVSSSLVFLSDQGLTPTLVIRQSQGNDLERDIDRINQCVMVRAKRTILVIPVLVLLLLFLTNASALAIIAVCISHLATLTYSTISTGLLGANFRYVEAISEPSSRLFLLFLGTTMVLSFDALRDTQTILFLYGAADVFMFIIVMVLYSRIRQKTTQCVHTEFQISPIYRLQSTLNAGAMNTMGVGETWALSSRSTPADYAFYGLISRVVDTCGTIAAYAGYSHLPQLLGSLQSNDWNAVVKRCRRILFFSLPPTTALACLVLSTHYGNISMYGYDLGQNWVSLLLFVLSTPAIVLSKYLILTLSNVDPKATMTVVLVMGAGLTIGVLWMYGVFGLSGTFVVLSIANFVRAGWLSLLTRRIRDKFEPLIAA